MAGHSTIPLFKKLGLKEGPSIKLVHAPEHYPGLINELMNTLELRNTATAELNFIHLFTNSRSEREELQPKLKRQIKKSETIWVSWYKGSAKKLAELTENIIRIPHWQPGWWTKVCAVDEEWSGLKLVFRLNDR